RRARGAPEAAARRPRTGAARDAEGRSADQRESHGRAEPLVLAARRRRALLRRLRLRGLPAFVRLARHAARRARSAASAAQAAAAVPRLAQRAVAGEVGSGAPQVRAERRLVVLGTVAEREAGAGAAPPLTPPRTRRRERTYGHRRRTQRRPRATAGERARPARRAAGRPGI